MGVNIYYSIIIILFISVMFLPVNLSMYTPEGRSFLYNINSPLFSEGVIRRTTLPFRSYSVITGSETSGEYRMTVLSLKGSG